MSHITNPTVCNNWHPKLGRKFADSVHSRRLWSSYSHDFLCYTDTARAHANPKTICAGCDERCSLFACDDIASNDFEGGICVLDPLDHVRLEDGISLRGVQNDNVQSSIYK